MNRLCAVPHPSGDSAPRSPIESTQEPMNAPDPQEQEMKIESRESVPQGNTRSPKHLADSDTSTPVSLDADSGLSRVHSGDCERIQGSITSGPQTQRSEDTIVAGSPDDENSEMVDAVDSILELGLPLPAARKMVVADFERRYIERVLQQSNGNIGQAAAASGIAGRYFRLLRARSNASAPRSMSMIDA